MKKHKRIWVVVVEYPNGVEHSDYFNNKDVAIKCLTQHTDYIARKAIMAEYHLVEV